MMVCEALNVAVGPRGRCRCGRSRTFNGAAVAALFGNLEIGETMISGEDGGLPVDGSAVTGNRFMRWLEQSLFPKIISYTIHPIHIFLLLILWIALLVIHATVFELVGGNYTNGLSAMAASIVLLQQTQQHREVRKLHRAHHDLVRSLHARLDRIEPADGAG